MARKSISIEKSLAELEELIRQMESAEIPLEELLKQYERAQKLLENCSGALQNIEQKVEQLIANNDTVTKTPFVEGQEDSDHE